MSWTSVTKPTGTTYTNVNPIGKQNYNDASLTYDASSATYDSTDVLAYSYVRNPNLAWNISKASFSQVFNLSAKVERIEEVFFSPDGLRCYVADGTNSKLHQYALSTAWDISTLSWVRTLLSVTAGYLDDIFFKEDGKTFYAVDSSFRKLIVRYDLSTAWDISTATLTSSYSAGNAGMASCGGVFFSPDGLKMFATDYGNSKVYQFRLETAWDITTTFLEESKSLASYFSGTPEGIFIKPDGKKFYMVDQATSTIGKVMEFDVLIPWDISTISFNQSLNVLPYGNYLFNVFFRGDGLKMYTTALSSTSLPSATALVNQFDFNEPYTKVAKP